MQVIQPKALILAISLKACVAIATAATTTLSLPMAALADTYVVEVIHARGEYYGIVVNNTTGEDLSVTEGHKNPAKAARQARRAAKKAAKEGDDIISGESACAMWPETCF